MWNFWSEYEGDKSVWNEVCQDDKPVSRRKGEWRVVNARTLRGSIPMHVPPLAMR